MSKNIKIAVTYVPSEFEMTEWFHWTETNLLYPKADDFMRVKHFFRAHLWEEV